jgi:hypothetical protein
MWFENHGRPQKTPSRKQFGRHRRAGAAVAPQRLWPSMLFGPGLVGNGCGSLGAGEWAADPGIL